MPARCSTTRRQWPRPRLLRVVLWLGLAVGVGLLAGVGVHQVRVARAEQALAADFDRQLRQPEPTTPAASAQGRIWLPTPRLPEQSRPVDRLAIPSVGLSTLVVEGVDAGELAVASGHDPHSVLPGVADNAVISGHRDGSFAALRSVRRGALIFTRTRYGTFRWTVTRLAVVSADDRSVLASTRPTAQLTLTTCYPFGYLGPAPQRFVLTARLVAGQTAYGQV